MALSLSGEDPGGSRQGMGRPGPLDLAALVKTVCGALCSMSGMAAMWTTASGCERERSQVGPKYAS